MDVMRARVRISFVVYASVRKHSHMTRVRVMVTYFNRWKRIPYVLPFSTVTSTILVS